MPYEAPDLANLSLSDIAELVAARKLPPVESWTPSQTGDSEMRIAADGTWYHQGGEIKRPAMVRAFSSLLLCDADGKHWLVTPPLIVTHNGDCSGHFVKSLELEWTSSYQWCCFP